MKIIRGYLSGHPLVRRFFHRVRRRYRVFQGGYPNWSAFKATASVPTNSAPAKRILIATSVGAHLPSATMESLLAAALRVRGADVHALLCDAALPACMDCDLRWFPRQSDQQRLVDQGPKEYCPTCFNPADRMYRDLGIEVHRYSDFLTADDYVKARSLAANVRYEKIRTFTWEGAAVGEHAHAGALRFYAKGELDEPLAEPIVRRYLESALLTTWMAQRLYKKYSFEAVVGNHGIYAPQGLINEAARLAGVRIVNWNPAYRKKCFIFSHGDTYHHTMMTEATGKWKNLAFGPDLEKKTMDYLKSRWEGAEDWISFQKDPVTARHDVLKRIGVDPEKPVIGLLTNVIWDAQLHYPANAFSNMIEWIIETVRLFQDRLDLQLLIRVHPAEVLGAIPSRQRVDKELEKHFPVFPKNVFLIAPENPVSTYTAMLLCDSVIIYGTKTGVELTSMGIPVIVAGEAWIRNKGLTVDISNRHEYRELIGRLPLGQRMKPEQIREARKYAFHFFFRRMIPVQVVSQRAGWPPYVVSARSMDDLLPGRDPGLDIICHGILEGTDFIYPEESRRRVAHVMA